MPGSLIHSLTTITSPTVCYSAPMASIIETFQSLESDISDYETYLTQKLAYGSSNDADLDPSSDEEDRWHANCVQAKKEKKMKKAEERKRAKAEKEEKEKKEMEVMDDEEDNQEENEEKENENLGTHRLRGCVVLKTGDRQSRFEQQKSIRSLRLSSRPLLAVSSASSSIKRTIDEIDAAVAFPSLPVDVASAAKRIRLSEKENEGVNAQDGEENARARSASPPPPSYEKIKRSEGPIPRYMNPPITCYCTDRICGRKCWARTQLVECTHCPSGAKCTNRPMTRGLEKEIEIYYISKEMGYGARAGEDIQGGELVAEYVGKMLSREEYNQLEDKDRCYIVEVGVGKDASTYSYIDAAEKGNHSRFLSSSCKPNCKAHQWNVNGEMRVGIFATRNVKKGETLTWPYGTKYFDKNMVCACPVCVSRRAPTRFPRAAQSTKQYVV